MIYPLLLSSPVSEHLWGGERLVSDFGLGSDDMKHAGEAWLLSCNKHAENTVKNGVFAGLNLSEAVSKMGINVLGENVLKFPYFPISVKLIDAKDRLSVKVHPDNEYALAQEGQHGKTKMWYVVDCEEDTNIIYGLKHEINRDELERRIRTNSLNEICNFVKVKKGDVFYIKPGTIYAAGKGILLAEVEQNTNLAYRISDYGRLGADGKPRPLHISKALDVINRKRMQRNDLEPDITIYPFGIVKTLSQCEYFTVEHLTLKGKAGLMEEKSFLSAVLLDGEAVLSYLGGSMRLKKGDSIFVPAKCRITLMGEADIICTHI